jgi:hypothetical protein
MGVQSCIEHNVNITNGEAPPGTFHCNSATFRREPLLPKFGGLNCWIKVITNICNGFEKCAPTSLCKQD